MFTYALNKTPIARVPDFDPGFVVDMYDRQEQKRKGGGGLQHDKDEQEREREGKREKRREEKRKGTAKKNDHKRRKNRLLGIKGLAAARKGYQLRVANTIATTMAAMTTKATKTAMAMIHARECRRDPMANVTVCPSSLDSRVE